MSFSKIPLFVLATSAIGLSAVNATTYCPKASDLVVAYNNAELIDQGWIINGGGGAATKAAFNLLGGSVEYDIDLSGVQTGVNGNIYTISPSGLGASGFDTSKYCDGAKAADQGWCVEVDWLESNGNCGGASTLHTVAGPGNNGCTAWGCRATYMYNGKASFHMRIEYDEEGHWTTIRDGQVISPTELSPNAGASDWNTLANAYKTDGAIVYSSLWVGWVPQESCGSGGSLAASKFSVTNLQITGTVVQGPAPAVCDGQSTIAPTETPTSGGSTGENCKALYTQCGGQGYNGVTCCMSGSACAYVNQWYSMCSASIQ